VFSEQADKGKKRKNLKGTSQKKKVIGKHAALLAGGDLG